jgi:hypothetical protein
METPVSKVFDVISPESRAVIIEELARGNPALLEELRGTQKPTNDQSNAVERVLAKALMKTFGPDWTPNKHGLAIERAINAYFNAWPNSY